MSTTADNTAQQVRIWGTPAYMSPEQARGYPIDQKSDIWAFGCVLYEMLTGHAAFSRGTIPDTIAAILEREPNWSALPPSTPPAIQRLLRRCLVKEISGRIPHIAVATEAISQALDRTESPNSWFSSAGRTWTLVTAALLAAVLVSAGLYILRSRSISQREVASLVRFYDNRAKDIEREMNQTVDRWRQTGPSDPSHDWQRSIQTLETNRARFKELHQRHLEALRAGQLTLGQLYAQLANEALTGGRVAYAKAILPPGTPESQEYRPSRDYREPATEILDAEGLTRIATDRSTPRSLRFGAAENLVNRCDASAQCVRSLAAIFEVEDLFSFWSQAGVKLCEAGSAARPVSPILVRVLANHFDTDDFRSDAVISTLRCIGYSDAEAVPYLVTIIQKPSEEYQRSSQRLAMQLLGDIGPTAAAGIPALRIISASSDAYSREMALYVLEKIEKR